MPIPSTDGWVLVLRENVGYLVDDEARDSALERLRLRAVLALESNGARTLVRLGYGSVGRHYDATYRSVQSAAAGELVASVEVFSRAHLLLRRHGQDVCRRVAPACAECAVARRCAARASGLPIGDPFATDYKPARREG